MKQFNQFIIKVNSFVCILIIILFHSIQENPEL